MTKPSEKARAITDFLDQVTKATYGRSRTESIEGDICVACGSPAEHFRDNLSRKEYSISGLCQKCQDETFGNVHE